MCVYSSKAYYLEELGAGMVETICKIIQQKVKNVVNELENYSEQFVM